MEKFDSAKYINNFKKDHYDQILLNIPKGGKEKLKILAGSIGKSMNQAIIDALQEYYNIDLK